MSLQTRLEVPGIIAWFLRVFVLCIGLRCLSNNSEAFLKQLSRITWPELACWILASSNWRVFFSVRPIVQLHVLHSSWCVFVCCLCVARWSFARVRQAACRALICGRSHLLAALTSDGRCRSEYVVGSSGSNGVHHHRSGDDLLGEVNHRTDSSDASVHRRIRTGLHSQPWQ